MTFSSFCSINDEGSGPAYLFSSCESDSLPSFFNASCCCFSRISLSLASLIPYSICAYSIRLVFSANSCSFLSLCSFFFSSALVSFFTFCFFSFDSAFSFVCFYSSSAAYSLSCCSYYSFSRSRFSRSLRIASCWRARAAALAFSCCFWIISYFFCFLERG